MKESTLAILNGSSPHTLIVPLTQYQTARLLERWLVLQGTEAAARAVMTEVDAARIRYRDELAAVSEFPPEAQLHVDFKNKTVTAQLVHADVVHAT